MDKITSGKYPNAFYRVATKALIRNAAGEILLSKERSKGWELPGGGLDHGESIHDALKRELYEEALITAPFTEKLLAIESIYVETKESWTLWLVYEIDITDLEYGVGTDTDEVTFIDPNILKDSKHVFERLIYKLARV